MKNEIIQARDKGQRCAQNPGKGWINPYVKGSPMHTAWDIGYRNDLCHWLQLANKYEIHN